jgi:hypothetical protein
MADVFASYGMPGTITSAVEAQVAAHAPLVPVHVAGFDDQPRMRPLPYRDSVGWLLLKHAVQLALVVAVVLFALHGGEAPLMALSYVATSLMMVGVFVIADRQRFQDRDPSFEILEILAPVPQPIQQPVVPPAPLAPLMEQMQAAIGHHVDVT